MLYINEIHIYTVQLKKTMVQAVPQSTLVKMVESVQMKAITCNVVVMETGVEVFVIVVSKTCNTS